jgi:hypothetical protein
MSRSPHWTVISSREVLDASPFLKVRVETVELPDRWVPTVSNSALPKRAGDRSTSLPISSALALAPFWQNEANESGGRRFAPQGLLPSPMIPDVNDRGVRRLLEAPGIELVDL